MGRLTTHVLDTAQGRPGSGIRVELQRLDERGAGTVLATTTTNRDGRTDKPLLEGEAFRSGTYQLIFHAGEYFRAQGVAATFVDVVPIRFGIADATQHYHVPLLCSPWSYTTYRGS
jgi:5-hydroxyisourate hydrolase